MSTTRPQVSGLTNAQEQYAEAFRQLHTVLDQKSWLADLLQALLADHEAGKLTPERAQWLLDFHTSDFEARVDTATELLRDTPLVLREQIRAAVERRPELLADTIE